MAADQQPVMISMYKNVWDEEPKDQTVDAFLNGVLMGTWQDVVFSVRRISDKKERSKAKQKAPLVTVSGSFQERTDAGLRKHSDFIAIDIDNVQEDINVLKSLLGADPYVYALFVSISGTGLCAIFRIDGDRHADAFEGIGHYLYERYQVVVDPSGRNISRTRFVSYDPDLIQNPKALKFKKYLPKRKEPKVGKVVYVKSDFDAIIKQFNDRGVNICEEYNQWVSIGHALNSQFPNSQEGRDYFHVLSALSPRYNYEECDNLYTHIERTANDSKAKKATIATIYYYAKLNGIQTYSESTRQIISATATLKKSGISSDKIAENLLKFEGIPISESQDIVNQAYAKDIELPNEESIVSEVERWLKYNCDLKRNVITRKLENHGQALEQKGLNSLFLSAKKAIEKLDYNLFERVLMSDNTVDYNPILDFFAAYGDRNETGLIDAVASTIKTPKPEFAKYFFKKWIVGAISSAHGIHSPLMFILAGSVQNTGKTEFFRRMLPKALKSYYAESKLDAGKDDEILMTNKWFIMDDEMGGKSKQESKRLKELTSKQTFSLREPYGRANVDLERLAVLCGTTNDLAILNDPTGNRRLIPVEVSSIDQNGYNQIDKIDLIMEAYHLYKSGFNWRLTKEDIEYLNANTDNMNDSSLEFELIQRYIALPEGESRYNVVEKSATEIKVYLEHQSSQKVSLKKLGDELKSFGFKQNIKKVNGKTCRLYSVVLIDDPSPQTIYGPGYEQIPF